MSHLKQVDTECTALIELLNMAVILLNGISLTHTCVSFSDSESPVSELLAYCNRNQMPQKQEYI